MKFRRQYPIEPFVVDFACVEHRLVVEIDGGYHDYVYEKDLTRQARIEAEGWRMIRFRNEDVLDNVEAVAIAIAKSLGLAPVFKSRRRN